MYRLLSKTTIFMAVILIVGCGTSTQVKVLKPAELDVGMVKKVAVLDFEFRGNWDFAGGIELPKTLKALGQTLLKQALSAEKSLDPLTAYPGKEISDMLVARLVNNKYYTVVERDQISKVLEEQALSLSGVIDETQAAEIGKLVGAEGLVMGSGSYSVKDFGKWETYTVKKKEMKRYRISRQVDVKITFKIVNVTTGSIVVSKTNAMANGQNGRVSAKYSTTANTEAEALKSIPDWRPIVDDMVNGILNQTIRQVAPHYVTESRAIEEGDSKTMAAAVEYAKRSLWEDARSLWEEVIEDPQADPEDQAAATYNIGLYYEIHGQLDEAETFFDKSFRMSGNSDYLDAKARIDQRRKELIRLKAQQE